MTDMQERAAKVAEEHSSAPFGHSNPVAVRYFHVGEKFAAKEIAEAIRALPADPTRAALEECVRAIEGLFANGFIDAGTREQSEWAQELQLRLMPIRTALATARNALEAK